MSGGIFHLEQIVEEIHWQAGLSRCTGNLRCVSLELGCSRIDLVISRVDMNISTKHIITIYYYGVEYIKLFCHQNSVHIRGLPYSTKEGRGRFFLPLVLKVNKNYG